MCAGRRWAPAWEWTWGTTCGCRATSCCALLSCTTLRSHSTPSLSLETGTAPAATATSPPRQPALLPAGQSRHAYQTTLALREWPLWDCIVCILRPASFSGLPCTISCSPVSKVPCAIRAPAHLQLVLLPTVPVCNTMRDTLWSYRWEEIQKHIGKLEKRHAVHIASYGEGNERRLTGKHETSSMHDFRCACSQALCRLECRPSVAAQQYLRLQRANCGVLMCASHI